VTGPQTSSLPGAGVASEILRRWRVLVGVPIATALVVAVIVLVIPVRFTAEAMFAPDITPSSTLSGSLSSLASSFGLAANGGPGSPYYYASLAISRPVLEALVTARYGDLSPPEKADSTGVGPTLMDIYGVSKRLTQHERIAKAIGILTDRIDVSTDDRTGIVTVDVSAPTPGLAATITQRLLEQIQALDARNRQARAAAEVGFLKLRMAEVHDSLVEAESTMTRFYQANRDLGTNATLKFREAELRSAYDLLNNLYTGLAQQKEQASLERVRNTPILNVLVPPVPPAEKSFPERTASVLVAFAFGLTFGLGYIILDLKRREAREAFPVDVERISTSWREMRHEIGSSVRRVVHPRRPKSQS
jgi:tyrosine-protein kinase Etk/Wzc